ncbi:MAG: DNA cytosine methyltransferase [Brasilonema angustatum HA4187-MV1]|jgi:site-specific DNA-cytosine methylase|nr:DNA cytosine methyltransferase [Brasilonema angustatum HA4187-MV1]
MHYPSQRPILPPHAPIFVSLFTGAGGADSGAASAGFRPVLGVEMNPKEPGLSQEFFKLHKINFCTYGSEMMLRTVQECAVAEFPRFPRNLFLLHASPVCSNFSTAKTEREEEYSDISSAWAVCEALRLLKPRYFTLENVCAYDKSAAFKMILNSLTDCGYKFHYKNVDMVDYGVAQNRKRLFLLGSLDRAMLFPPKRSRKGWGDVIDWDQLIPCELTENQQAALDDYLQYNSVKAIAIERYTIGSNRKQAGSKRTFHIRQESEPFWTLTKSMWNDGKTKGQMPGGRKMCLNVWKDGQAFYLPMSQAKLIAGFEDWYYLPEDQSAIAGAALGLCVAPKFYTQLLAANFPSYARSVRY